MGGKRPPSCRKKGRKKKKQILELRGQGGKGGNPFVSSAQWKKGTFTIKGEKTKIFGEKKRLEFREKGGEREIRWPAKPKKGRRRPAEARGEPPDKEGKKKIL